MQAQIKIIKRAANNGMTAVPSNPIAKSDRQRERETVDTVKGWVADWHERQVQLQAAADALIRSVGIRRDGTTQRLVKVH
jgi:hypothetical protein